MAGTDPMKTEVRPGLNLAHLVLKTGGASVKSFWRATPNRAKRQKVPRTVPHKKMPYVKYNVRH